MAKRVLITGGAGFIGSHLADELLGAGWDVRVLDALDPQVHGPGRPRPDYLADDVELQVGDVRDPLALRDALVGVEAVVHLAAAVGVGQSMYEVARYTGVNSLGTAVLLEALTRAPGDAVRRLVVASSMSIYGEGRYVDGAGAVHDAADRTREQLEARTWDPLGPDGAPLRPVPTPEDKVPRLGSIYALTKYDQERLCLIAGRAYQRPTVAMRIFNTYGPRQALSNPYTGVLANFASRLLNDRPPLVFEDGQQRRDLVHVRDVARAFRLALESDLDQEVFNVGSGRAWTIGEVARLVGRVLGRELEPEITGRYRVGDIRHCTADGAHARDVLGFMPEISLEDGVAELGEWLSGQVAEDRSDVMQGELARRGLTL